MECWSTTLGHESIRGGVHNWNLAQVREFGGWVRLGHLQRTCRKRSGRAGGAMSLFGERSAPLDGAETVATLEPVKLKRAYHQPSRDLRNWVVDYALLRHDDGWETRRKGALIHILQEKCDRVGEASVPISASVMQPTANTVAEQHGMTRRFGDR